MLRFVLLYCLAISAWSPAVALESVVGQLFDKLRHRVLNIHDGSSGEDKLAEYIAVLALEERFPAPRYYVGHSVTYVTNGQIKGELDAVVWDLEERRVVKIVEVKNSRSGATALRHARKQLERFESAIASKLPVIISVPMRDAYYEIDRNQFKLPWSKEIMGRGEHPSFLKFDKYELNTYEMARLWSDLKEHQIHAMKIRHFNNGRIKEELSTADFKRWENAPFSIFKTYSNSCEDNFSY